MNSKAEAKKSILIVGNYPPPFGGVPRVLEYLVASLKQAGWDVVIMSHAGVPGVTVVEGVKVFRLSRLERVCGAMRQFRLLKLLFSVEAKSFLTADLRAYVTYLGHADGAIRIARRHKCQLIYAVNLTYGIPPAVLAAHTLGLPLVASIYGEVYTHADFLRRHPDWVATMFRQPQRMLAMTRHCASSPRQIGMERPLEVLAHGVDLQFFSPGCPRNGFRERYALPREGEIVLFVGRQTQEMGLDQFMLTMGQLWQKQRPLHALIVGARGPLTGAAEVFRARQPERVTILTDIPYADLPDCYRIATLAILPTSGQRACGSLAAIEAMGCGRPVLASRVGGIPEVVDDRVTGFLFAPKDTTGIVAVAELLLSDLALAARLGARGREVALARFEQGAAATAYVQLFDEVRARIPAANL